MWRNNIRKILGLIFGLAIVVLIAGVSGGFGRTAAVEVPRTVGVKGEFIDYLQVRGEVKAVRSVPLTVPTTGGSGRRILEMAIHRHDLKEGQSIVQIYTWNER